MFPIPVKVQEMVNGNQGNGNGNHNFIFLVSMRVSNSINKIATIFIPMVLSGIKYPAYSANINAMATVPHVLMIQLEIIVNTNAIHGGKSALK